MLINLDTLAKPKFLFIGILASPYLPTKEAVLFDVQEGTGIEIKQRHFLFYFPLFFFFFWSALTACGSFQARDPTCTTAMTQASNITTPDH